MTGLSRHADGRMGVDEIGHPVMREQAIAGGKLDALEPFGGLLF